MCDRTIKMKINKDSILQDVNSNTNSIELTVEGLERLEMMLQVMGVQPTKPNIERYTDIIRNNTKAFGRHKNNKDVDK
jgi:hypothetical protein